MRLYSPRQPPETHPPEMRANAGLLIAALRRNPIDQHVAWLVWKLPL